MKIFDLISMCIRNLVRRKFRTFLTVTGVVIGTTSIIMMISLGIGISTQQEEQLKMWGDLSIINVWGGNPDIVLDDVAVETMQNLPGVDVATPFVYVSFGGDPKLYAGSNWRYRWQWPSIYAVYPDALEKLGYKIDQGTSLPAGKTKKLQIVFGSDGAYQFEDTKKKFNNWRWNGPDENGIIQPPFFDPLTTPLKFTIPPTDGQNTAKTLEYEAEVCGVLVGERNKDGAVWGAFISLNDYNRMLEEYNKENGIKTSKKEKTNYNQVYVKALNINDVTDIQAAITEMGFGTWSMETQRQEMQKNMQQMQLILAGLGGISLLVSAISITNTMIMSVYERTREIGVMKVLGCLVGNIRSIFLVEAGLIGFFGGLAGIGLSFGLSFFLNRFGSMLSGGGMFGGMFGYYGGDMETKMSIIPPWLVLLGIIFATAIGLVSGFYPANRAVRISALEAIKQE